MDRALLTLVVSLFTPSLARADVLPGIPLPRVILIDHTISTDKKYPEYLFFLIADGTQPIAVKLDPETPIEYRGTLNDPDRVFVAVPRESRLKYPTPKEFEEAITSFQVEGIVRSKQPLVVRFLVRRSDHRSMIFREHRVESIDVTEGIVVVTKDVPSKTPVTRKKEVSPKKDTDPKNDAAVKELDRETTSSESVSPTPESGWIAGLAGSLAVLLGGVWLVRRVRGKNSTHCADS